jgi:CRP-like cAMP-binding protein
MITIPEARRAAAEGPRTRIQRALKLSLLFDRASRTIREAAINAAEIEIVPGHTVVVRQGATPATLVLLSRGRARVERMIADGRSVPLGYRGSGDVLGESCLGDAREHNESIITMEEAEIVRMPLGLVTDFITGDTAMGAAVLGMLLERQRETEERIQSLLFRNVEGRLAEFLIKAADRWGVPVPKGELISAPITHLEIAQAIGSTRETVTLTLGALRREGLLDVAGRRLILKDREMLAKRQ